MNRSTGYTLLGALAIIGFILILTSCDDRPAPVAQVIQQPAPQVVQAAPAPVIVQQSSNDGFWQGMMLGHMFSSGPTVVHHYDSRPAYVAPRSTTIVNNTTVVNKTVTRPAAVVVPRSTYTAPRATSYSGSYSSRSSYSSSSYSRR